MEVALGLLALSLLFVLAVTNIDGFVVILLLLSLIVPINFTSVVGKINIGGFNFSIIDVCFISLFMLALVKFQKSSVFKFSNQILLAFIGIQILFLLMGLFVYNDYGQSFFDVRPIFYYGVLFIRFDRLGVSKSKLFWFDILIVGMVIYSLMCLSLYFGFDNHPYKNFLSEESGWDMGRISFQQDYLLILTIPLALYSLSHKNYTKTKRFLYGISLGILLLKLFSTMSRGLMFFVLLNMLLIEMSDNNGNFSFRFVSLLRFFKGLVLLSLLVVILLFFVRYTGDQSLLNGTTYMFSRIEGILNINRSNSFYSAQIGNRLLMWRTGWQEVLNSFFFGNGYGYTFNIDHPEWRDKKLSFIDSSWVTLVIRSGVISFGLFFLVFMNLVRKARLFLRSNNSEFIYLKQFYTALIVFLIFSSVNVLFVFSLSLFPFVLLTSLVLE